MMEIDTNYSVFEADSEDEHLFETEVIRGDYDLLAIDRLLRAALR